MKVFYLANTESRNFEGRTQISTEIKKYLVENNIIFVSNPYDADLIHVHSSGIFDSYKAYKLKKKYKKPCIFSLYSISETKLLGHFLNYYTQKIITKKFKGNFILSSSASIPIKIRGLFLKKLDCAVVASEYSRKKLYPNTRLINFGIDVNKFKPIEINKNEKIKVGFFGHPSATKGITDFIKATKFFSKDLEIYLYSSRCPEELVQYTRKHSKSIKVVGFVEDINLAYNQMDIIVLPYRNSLGAISNPLVLLEAMATSSAVVTTDLPYIKEIVNNSAIITKPYSPKILAKTVNDLALDPKLRKDLGLKARKIIIEKYDKDIMLKKYLELYQNFLK